MEPEQKHEDSIINDTADLLMVLKTSDVEQSILRHCSLLLPHILIKVEDEVSNLKLTARLGIINYKNGRFNSYRCCSI